MKSNKLPPNNSIQINNVTQTSIIKPNNPKQEEIEEILKKIDDYVLPSLKHDKKRKRQQRLYNIC